MKLRIAAIATLLLAGCGSQSANQQSANQQAGGNQQAATPTATAAAGGNGSLTIQPGEWEITMEMRTTQASGMPAGMTMPQMPPTTIRSCVTPEQVSRANANFLSGGGHAGMNCDYSGVTVADGRIQGTSTCSRAGHGGKGHHGRQLHADQLRHQSADAVDHVTAGRFPRPIIWSAAASASARPARRALRHRNREAARPANEAERRLRLPAESVFDMETLRLTGRT